MKLKIRHGTLRSKRRLFLPTRIILHHTAGGSMRGAVTTLAKRGLSYHAIVDKDGTIHEFVPANRMAFHAYKNNRGTVGISFVGGGKYGPAAAKQIDAAIEYINALTIEYPNLKELTGHKHVDPRGWKIDPRFRGEPTLGINWEVDKKYMTDIAARTGLEFVTREELF